MQSAAPVFLDVVCDQPRHHPATRTQPARQMRHADADLRRLQRIAQGAESLLENIEQGLPVNPVMRKHRFTPQQIAPIRILVITAQHLGVIRHHPGRVSRIQHAGGRRPGGNTGNHPRAQLELRRHHLPKTRLPPTAVAAARKDHLIKHARIPYSITHKPHVACAAASACPMPQPRPPELSRTGAQSYRRHIIRASRRVAKPRAEARRTGLGGRLQSDWRKPALCCYNLAPVGALAQLVEQRTLNP